MYKYDINNIMECFKMSVDLKKVKEIEEYIKELEENNGILVSQVESWSKTADIYMEENNRLKKQRQELRSWLEEEIKEEYRLHKEFLRIGVIKGETKLTSQFKRVLSKLNELEGKNE